MKSASIYNESTAGADASVEVPKLHNIKLLIASFYTHIDQWRIQCRGQGARAPFLAHEVGVARAAIIAACRIADDL